VGGFLNLPSLKSIPEGFNPTVGGSLSLYSLKSIPAGFNPTVGGSLYLYSLESIPEGFNPVCSDLYYHGEWNRPHIPSPTFIRFPGTNFFVCDGIFGEIIKHKGKVYHCKSLSQKEFVLLSDGSGRYSHGNTLKEAKESLLFKISSRDKSVYSSLTVDSELSYEKMIVCYRVITGACEFGVRNFIERKVPKPKRKYSVKEILKLTEGEFGHTEFKNFFKKN
jgi:hypothetical protein